MNGEQMRKCWNGMRAEIISGFAEQDPIFPNQHEDRVDSRHLFRLAGDGLRRGFQPERLRTSGSPVRQDFASQPEFGCIDAHNRPGAETSVAGLPKGVGALPEAVTSRSTMHPNRFR